MVQKNRKVLMIFLRMKTTVDGSNPAAPNMYETL